MYANIVANPKTCGSLARATVALGLTLAAIGVIGFGAGAAGADPQQPVLIDDPAPAVPDPGSAVDVANAIMRQFGSLLDGVLPGSSSLLMPGTSGPNPLSPVAPGYPNSVQQGQYPASPGYPNSVQQGQYPASPGYPNSVQQVQNPAVI